jgi:hypothetical protein
MSLAVVGVLYGVFCEVMAFCNRRPGLPHYSLLLSRDELTERGRVFHSRGWRAWLVGMATFVIANLLVPS